MHHVTHINESCHTYLCMSHATHTSSRHTYEYVMSTYEYVMSFVPARWNDRSQLLVWHGLWRPLLFPQTVGTTSRQPPAKYARNTAQKRRHYIDIYSWIRFLWTYGKPVSQAFSEYKKTYITPHTHGGQSLAREMRYQFNLFCWIMWSQLPCNTLEKVDFIRVFVIATYCNALQRAATHCYALQHNATHCNTLQHWNCITLQHWSMLHHTATRYNALQCTTTFRTTLQHTAKSCAYMYTCVEESHLPHDTLQHTAPHCIALHHAASRCEPLQEAQIHTEHVRTHLRLRGKDSCHCARVYATERKSERERARERERERESESERERDRESIYVRICFSEKEASTYASPHFSVFLYWSLLQCVAVCVAVHCSVLQQCVAVHCIVLQYVAFTKTHLRHSSLLLCCSLCVVLCCSVVQCVAVHCSALHHAAVTKTHLYNVPLS